MAEIGKVLPFARLGLGEWFFTRKAASGVTLGIKGTDGLHTFLIEVDPNAGYAGRGEQYSNTAVYVIPNPVMRIEATHRPDMGTSRFEPPPGSLILSGEDVHAVFRARAPNGFDQHGLVNVVTGEITYEPHEPYVTIRQWALCTSSNEGVEVVQQFDMSTP
jgi:hypothetical protein